MIGIPDESVNEGRNWMLDSKGRLGVMYCPRSGMVGIFMSETERWYIHGPMTFDEALAFLRDQVPEILPSDDFAEIWRARIEQASARAH